MQVRVLEGSSGIVAASISVLILIFLTNVLARKTAKSNLVSRLIYGGIAVCSFLVASFSFTNFAEEESRPLLAVLAAFIIIFFRVTRMRTNRDSLPAELERVLKEFKVSKKALSHENIFPSDRVRLYQEIILGAGLLHQSSPGKLRRLGYDFIGDFDLVTKRFTVTKDVRLVDCEIEIRKLCEFVVVHDGKYLLNYINKI
jgi:hypothetical protein